MTKSNAELADELEQRVEQVIDGEFELGLMVRVESELPQIIAALRAEREPATEAVLELIKNLQQGPQEYPDLAPYAKGWNNALYALKNALKGKGASQGAARCPKCGALPLNFNATGTRVFFRCEACGNPWDVAVPASKFVEVAAPEPSGDFVMVPRRVLDAAWALTAFIKHNDYPVVGTMAFNEFVRLADIQETALRSMRTAAEASKDKP